MTIAHEPGSTPLAAVLGPASGRYFASGYKGVRYEVRAIDPDARVAGQFRAVTAAHYPDGWSRGADGVPRTPHLSSVDAIALPLIVLENLVDARCLSAYRVGHVDLRAPKRPRIDVANIPVALDMQGVPGWTDLSLAANVGGMRARLDLCLSQTRGSLECEPSSRPSVYTEGFRHVRTETALTAHAESSSIDASHVFEPEPGSLSGPMAGVEAVFSPAVSAIDLLVTMGQMTQAAIYLSVPVERRRGDLWMRSMTIDIDATPSALPCTLHSTTTITRDRALDRDGRRLRDIEVESAMETSVRARARLVYVERASSDRREAKV